MLGFLLLSEDSSVKAETFHCCGNGSANVNVSGSIRLHQFFQFDTAWEKKGRLFHVDCP